jgi:hypothetical protein
VIDSDSETLAFVQRHGVVTLGRHATVPSLTEALAGEPVRGSWWSHKRGDRIFALLSSLMESGQVASVKLLDGKVTFVHRDRWPALYRVVTDRAFRDGRLATLSAAGKKLLARVEKAGELQVEAGAAKNELERSLLVHAEQEHTDAGHHATVMRTWRKWAPRGLAAQARKLSVDAARQQLALRTS